MTSSPTYAVSADTRAVLLLCGSLNQPRLADPKPLTLTEYNRVAQTLQAHARRPADLLQPGILEALDGAVGIDRDRLAALLDRGAALALAVESWTNRGLWIISRGDTRYPVRLKARLKGSAPPILYGVGEAGLLTDGGLVIVGSRDVDAPGLAFTERIALRCAVEETPVISGGARGVDAAAMETALDSGGRVVGVLADGLAKAAVAKAYREALRKGALVLCSPYDPAAGFAIGNAMGRNRHIYGLGDAALVVSAAANAGGTWAGAIENLKHGWLPLHVHADGDVPQGNRRLIEHGGRPFVEAMTPEGTRLLDWMTAHRPADSGESRREAKAPHVADPDQRSTSIATERPADTVASTRPAEQLSLLPLLADRA